MRNDFAAGFMPAILTGAGAAFEAVALLFFTVLLSTIFGAVTGFVAGLFFEQTIRGFLGALGADTSYLAMWQIGAGLGFLAGFFRSPSTGGQA